MMCTCIEHIGFQFRYSFMCVIQEKEIHASTPKNDEFNSVDGRQEVKGTHSSTPENNEFNWIEGRQEIKRTYASTWENDEFN